MKGLRIISLVALWSLAVNAITPLVQGASGVSVNTESLKPETVKDAVDLLGKLAKETTLKKTFIDKLEQRVKDYFNVDEDPNKGYRHNLEELLKNINDLRPELLENPNDFGMYSQLDESGVTAAVISADRWLPLLHSSDGFGIGGNQWCNNHFGSRHTGTNIHKWLTDKLQTDGEMYTMRKGYNDTQLKSGGRATVKVSGYLGISYYSGGSLNYAQYGLFPNTGGTFFASNLASVLLFMAEFCRDIKEAKFEKAKDEKIKNSCKQFSENIDSLHKVLLPLFNPESYLEDEDDEEASGRSRVIRNRMYEGRLKSEKYDEYVTFVIKSIPHVSTMLQQMRSDSSGWSVESLTSGHSHGPFKYGYVFHNKKWDSAIYYDIKPHIDELLKSSTTGSLHSLLECLDPDRAVNGKEQVKGKSDTPTEKEDEGEAASRVDTGEKDVTGNTKEESSEKVTVPTTPQPQPHPQPESVSKMEGTSDDDGHAEHRPADSEEGTVTPGEKVSKDESKEADEEDEEGEDDDGDGEAASDVEGRTTEENSAKGPTETKEGDIPNEIKRLKEPSERNGDNLRLILARSGEGNEEEGAESLPSATPGTPTSPGRQGNLEGKGDASKAGKHTNESESNTEQRNGGKNAVVPDQRPGSPKTGNRGPVGPQTPPRNDQPPQRRRTHPQGDNAPKAIREEAELPSESSFSGIHACGILIATCIFTVV